MSKFSKIKERLASLLIEVEFATLKTDKAVFEYDGEELVEGTKVYVIDEETNERVAAADGEYTTEDNKVITVANGEVVSIVEKEEEPIEEPVEEPVAEEVVETEEEPVEEPTEEPTEEPVEEPKDEVAELKTKVEELTAIVNELIGLVEDMKKETEEKFSKISLAKPASEEFEQTTIKKTGDARVDKLLNAWGKK
jgi:outer membrane biosynthesis protein TonB